MNIVTKAIKEAGGVSKLARQFKGANGKPMVYQSLLKWEKNGIPPNRYQEFTKVTGIPPEQVDPKLAAYFTGKAA